MSVAIFVEGPADQLVLSKLLGDIGPKKAKLIVAGGRDAAWPRAQQHLLLKGEPAALVIDADTNNRQAAQNQVRELEYYFRMVTPDAHFKIIQFVPQIEVIFFECPKPLERYLIKPLSGEIELAGRYAPKEILGKLMTDFSKFVRQLSDDDLKSLRELEPIKSLREFILGAGVQHQRLAHV